MIALILIACLNTDCREVQLGGPMSLFECMTSSQPLVAQWIMQHPGYKVKKMHCTPPRGTLL